MMEIEKQLIENATTPLVFPPRFYQRNYWWIDWIMIALSFGIVGFIIYLTTI